MGIARAFVTRPRVMFADEPTGNLDSKTTAEVMQMICGFARAHGQTIVLVTHDPNMAAYADRIVTLIDGLIVSDERVEHPGPDLEQLRVDGDRLDAPAGQPDMGGDQPETAEQPHSVIDQLSAGSAHPTAPAEQPAIAATSEPTGVAPRNAATKE